MQGKFCVKGMNFHAFHGSLEVERELGQVFSINVSLGFPVKAEDITPSVESPIRGADVYDETKSVVMGSRFHSHTSLALAIAKAMFSRFEVAETATVTIARKQLFIAGTVDEVTAEISCERKDLVK